MPQGEGELKVVVMVMVMVMMVVCFGDADAVFMQLLLCLLEASTAVSASLTRVQGVGAVHSVVNAHLSPQTVALCGPG